LALVYDPTASQFVADTHDTALKRVAVALATFALALIDHAVPFQCSVKVLVTKLLEYDPTATQLVADAHDTPTRVMPLPTGLGDDLIDHPSPFQCSINVLVAFDVVELPTATHIAGPAHDTPLNWLVLAPATFGLDTTANASAVGAAATAPTKRPPSRPTTARTRAFTTSTEWQSGAVR
jgi:hypothetical protein